MNGLNRFWFYSFSFA